MNPDLQKLQAYPFERLAKLKEGVTAPADRNHIALSIGEPKHAAPKLATDALIASLDGLSGYPATKGLPELLQTISEWLTKRFHLANGAVNPDTQILPVNGTREALFAFAHEVIDRSKPNPLVVMPNPFYQIYEGASLLSGAEPYFLNCEPENGFIPDVDTVPEEVWQRCQLLYICSPGNPTGAVTSSKQLKAIIELADKYDFIIASDECYSEIYLNENSPPVGLLQVCAEIGRNDFKRCVIFQSLSKRSNLPGLRSGFVAGDAEIIQSFLQYRTYHGCAMPLPTQHASIAAWQDESHVVENRQLYREKFAAVLPILAEALPAESPEASFFIWLKTPVDDQQFARELFAAENVTVLPGSYLARDTKAGNPGKNRVRIALVAPLEECVDAARRIARFANSLEK